jgi:ubiquinone/menaquinone biosynthesis C-methylase UbiE
MDFSIRSYQKELLDRDDIPFPAIERNMRELDIINTWLGGHAITLSGLKQLIQHKAEITVCEIGCGGGDNLLAIQQWCGRKKIKTTFTGIDINPDCIKIARSKIKDPESDFIVCDYRKFSFEKEKPDIIFSSLFCHHFTNDELVTMLEWMQANSGTGFFINDLHRHAAAYYSIKTLTTLFSRSYLVKNDAPLSVLRGFNKQEWKYLLQKAGIKKNSIQWKWAFRWLIVVSCE